MKKLINSILIFFVASVGTVAACPACEQSQPKILRGITHGAGPDSRWDYLIVYIAVIIVLATLFFSVKWLVKPGEKSKEHIKRMILNNQ
ncbi:hypothetical protein [Parafilimonas terrae]|jgi:hypothetical protein|uniref:Cbb3-type cytochrome oxidase component FixQ n=1 Tax=Parafilimonas terrae TaxID=1465490 RepID=A0A1I5TT27_9BACT|nr:hypothetical protein [Parafilimonas terrae]SFP86212.1 hypothetical protein SAMN05444277_102290 [Parafilimonas terrae]